METDGQGAVGRGSGPDDAHRDNFLYSFKALKDTTDRGEEVTVSGIARHAGIDRTFLFRHRDLLEQVHAAEAEPPAGSRDCRDASAT